MQTKFKRGINVVALTVIILGILTFLQILSTRHPLRFDLTETKRYSLSEKSKKVLKLLNRPIKAIAFYGEKEFGRNEVEELLEEYRYNYPKFSYEFVDPVKNPAMVKKYNIQSHGTIVLEYKGRKEKVISREEEDLTNAILKLIREQKKIIYFLTGHGEKGIFNKCSKLREALESENYKVKELSLLREEKIPENASCLVIPGPEKNFFNNELQAIADYIKNGGKIVIMIDPYRCPSMEKFLVQYGIELDNDTIVDKTSKILGGEYLFPVVTKYESHPVTRNLNYASFFPIARSLKLKTKNEKNAEVEALAKTGKDAWGETNRKGLIEGKASFDKNKDIPGPLIIGAVASIPIQEKKKSAKLVVYGDSDFASNDYLEVSGNKDLILNTIGWLAEEESLISIRPREWGYTPIILSEKQSKILFWISVIILPLLVAGIGIGVLTYRKWKG
ncbi:GldG family protein [Candidatus Aerophobetes bacterium]|nr:GldG family protein [Candidatus Aerophobetes bacterium]